MSVGTAVAVDDVLMRLTVDVTGPFQPSAAAIDEACASAMLSLCGRAAQYAKMTLRIKMVKDSRSSERRIHWRVRFVDLIDFFSIGLGTFWELKLLMDDESELDRD